MFNRTANLSFINSLFFYSELLGFGQKSNAYYIRCHDCHDQFKEDPEVWKEWQEQFAETEKKYRAAVEASK